MPVFRVTVTFDGRPEPEVHYCDAVVAHEAGREIQGPVRFIETQAMFCLILDRGTYTHLRTPWLFKCRDEGEPVDFQGNCPRCQAGDGEPCTQPTPMEERHAQGEARAAVQDQDQRDQSI